MKMALCNRKMCFMTLLLEGVTERGVLREDCQQNIGTL